MSFSSLGKATPRSRQAVLGNPRNQAERQGAKTGARDAGNRTAVTGGKQLDGFVELVRDFLVECGIGKSCIFFTKKSNCPAGSEPRKNGICWLS